LSVRTALTSGYFAFVSNVVYTSDTMLNYLRSTNCFDELFCCIWFYYFECTW